MSAGFFTPAVLAQYLEYAQTMSPLELQVQTAWLVACSTQRSYVLSFDETGTNLTATVAFPDHLGPEAAPMLYMDGNKEVAYCDLNEATPMVHSDANEAAPVVHGDANEAVPVVDGNYNAQPHSYQHREQAINWTDEPLDTTFGADAHLMAFNGKTFQDGLSGVLAMQSCFNQSVETDENLAWWPGGGQVKKFGTKLFPEDDDSTNESDEEALAEPEFTVTVLKVLGL